MVGTTPRSNYWSLEGNVSTGFNRLKGKLFNLVEASVIDRQQCEAVKGLIKGFANDEFRICIENMRYTGRNAGFIPEGSDSSMPSLGAEPLETTER